VIVSPRAEVEATLAGLADTGVQEVGFGTISRRRTTYRRSESGAFEAA